jgi:hypothetical protein
VSLAGKAEGGAKPCGPGAENRHARQASYCTLPFAGAANARPSGSDG